MIQESQVYRSFPLLTNGRDTELDAMGIVVEVASTLQGHEIARILTYLLARYTYKPGAEHD